MCFSAQASFTAGTALAAVGAATIIKAKKNKNKRQIAFAAIPLIFAIQQLTEGFVWLSFAHPWPMVHTIAIHIFAFFAYAWWPMFIPFAIGLLEVIAWRKRVIDILWAIGLAVGGILFYCILAYPVYAHVVNNCIAYNIKSEPDVRLWFIVLYGVAVLGSMFISSRKIVTIFGAVTTLSLIATYFFFEFAFVSVWCFFAAILSAIIYFHFTAPSAITVE